MLEAQVYQKVYKVFPNNYPSQGIFCHFWCTYYIYCYFSSLCCGSPVVFLSSNGNSLDDTFHVNKVFWGIC